MFENTKHLAFGALVWTAAWAMAGAAHALPEQIYFESVPYSRGLAERLDGQGPVTVAGHVLDGAALRDLYGPRGYAPLWINTDGIVPQARAFRRAIERAPWEGLDRIDYHPDAIDAGLNQSRTGDLLSLELLLSDAVMRYGADVQAGRFNPETLGDLVDYQWKPVNKSVIALSAATAVHVGAYIDALSPQHTAYQTLRQALETYRSIDAAGGWPAIPDGPMLKPGEAGPEIPAVRARLSVTEGYVVDASTAGDLTYDAPLAAALKRFQERHGLAVDGVLGPRTRAALNVTAAERVAQIIVNMERWRWLPPDLGSRHIMVNLPEYRMTVVDDGRLVRHMDVIVGAPHRQTPLFSSALTWLEFNPTWTMPTSIAIKDYLPKLVEDPAYLVDHNIRLYSGWGQDRIEMYSETMDWRRIGKSIKYFMLRQDPGPDNALGKVKFMMANTFSVYLHDTNERALFDQRDRAVSSGCVRVADPIWLADYLLAGAPEWQGDVRDQVLGTWQTTRVSLPERMPVHLGYFTVFAGDDGRIQFRDDIYGVDAAMARQLMLGTPRLSRVALSQ